MTLLGLVLMICVMGWVFETWVDAQEELLMLISSGVCATRVSFRVSLTRKRVAASASGQAHYLS